MTDKKKLEEPTVWSKKEIEEFKKEYSCCQNGKYNLEVQVPYLKKLAEGYKERYQKSGNWTDMLKAHALFNSVGVRCPKEEIWARKAYEIQQMYWEGVESICFEQQQAVISATKLKLEEIRGRVQSKLKIAENYADKFEADVDYIGSAEQIAMFHKAVEEVSVGCTNDMISLANAVFVESVSALSMCPPCRFCVVGIGSMAKGEATPYSDLEYMFLIERKDAETVKYFEKLAVTSYFFIGNLRETKLSYMNIAELKGWFDDRQQNGFKIDGLAKGAGNIPTGNGFNNEKNHFILTPGELLQKYKEVLLHPVDEDARRGDLTAMLQYTTILFSSDSTAKDLDLLKQFTQQRAKVKTNEIREKSNTDMFEADVVKHNFRPNQALISNGYTVDSKRDLYRYPSILLFNISILTKQQMEDSWNTLRSLEEMEMISSSLYHSLSFLLACACYFRLSAYLYHNSQDDRVSVLPTSCVLPIVCKSTDQVSLAGRRWYIPQGLFSRHCEHVLLVKDHIRKSPINNILSHLKNELAPLNWLMKFYVHYCCNRWTEGLKIFHENISEEALQEQPEEAFQQMKEEACNDVHVLWNSVKALSYCLFQYRKWGIALNFTSNVKSLVEKVMEAKISDEKTQQLILSDVLEETGNCYNNLQQSEKAKELFVASLRIRQRHLEPTDDLIAMSHYAIGDRAKALRNFDEAEYHARQALQIAYCNASKVVQYDYHGNPITSDEEEDEIVEDLTTKSPIEILRYLNNSSVMLARVTWNIGRTYFTSKRYHYAVGYWKKTKEILQEMYGEQACHREMGSISLNYAMGCDMTGNYGEADTNFRRAFAIYTRVCTGTDEGLLAALIDADNRSVTKEGNEKYYETAVETFRSLPGFKTPHPQTAAVLQHYSLHLVHMGQHQLAEKLLKECLEIYDSHQGSKGKDYYNESKAYIKSVLALSSWKTGNFKQGEELYNEALVLRADETESVQIYASEILQSKAAMYTEMTRYDDAKTCLSKALKIYEEKCTIAEHPKLAELKDQMANIENQCNSVMAHKRKCSSDNLAETSQKRKN